MATDNLNQRPVPYNTGKVKIGVYYTPHRPPEPVSRDALRLQTALLRVHTPWYRRVLPTFSRMFDL